MPEFNDWFPTSRHGGPTINVMDFGAIADGVGHPLGSGGSAALGYPTLLAAQTGDATGGGNGKAYPSATSLTDYADWCAITEALKAAFTEDGVRHNTQAWLNKPVKFPAGIYVINKPVDLIAADGVILEGTGNWTQIYNENPTAPDNICFKANGLRYGRIENFTFQATGTDCIAFDLNADGIVPVNTNSNLWINVHFIAINGVGCWIARNGIMGSEQTFIRCIALNCKWGWVVSNPNALSYQFITSGGTDCTESCIRINTGGCVCCINCFFAANAVDIDNYASGPVTAINCRSESLKFIRGGARTNIIGCTQSSTGSETVLVETSGIAFISGTDCAQSRLVGEGEFQVDGGLFQHAANFVRGVSDSGGLVKITHDAVDTQGHEHWRDGDQVKIWDVVGSTYPTAPSVNDTWIINKLNATSFELVGSNYVADTYNITAARMGPGPDYATRGLTFARQVPTAYRPLSKAYLRNDVISWLDSGYLITNSGAAGAVTLTLPDPSNSHWANCRGTAFRFVVIPAQSLTITISGAWTPPVRIYRGGGYATGGTQITSNTMGSMLELMLVDGQGAGPTDTTVDAIGHRWLVIAETGTWTISGTLAGTARAAEEAKLRSRYGAPSRRLPQAQEPVA